jgi:hypothetical protein
MLDKNKNYDLYRRTYRFVIGQYYGTRVVTHTSKRGGTAILYCTFCNEDILITFHNNKDGKDCGFCDGSKNIYARFIIRRSPQVLQDIEDFRLRYPKIDSSEKLLVDPYKPEPVTISMGYGDVKIGKPQEKYPDNPVKHPLTKSFELIRDEIKDLKTTSTTLYTKEDIWQLQLMFNNVNFNVWESKRLVTLNISKLLERQGFDKLREIWEPICKKHLGDDYKYNLYYYELK